MFYLFLAACGLIGLGYCAFQLYHGLRHGEMRGLGFGPIFNDEPPLDRKEDRLDFWITAATRVAVLLVGTPVVIKTITVGIMSL